MAHNDRRWNLNIHYHRVILDAAPTAGSRVLDIGCGDGLLSFDLAEQGHEVVGLDLHAPSIERASADLRANHRTTFVCGDLFTHHFEPASFDMVASSATLHHIDAREALRRMKQLVCPNGVVAIIGFAQPDGPKDRLLMLAGALIKCAHQLGGRYWEHTAPVSWPPPLTTSEMYTLAHQELPGVTFRRLMSNRFSLIWQAPEPVEDSHPA